MKKRLFTASKLLFFFGLGIVLIWLSLKGLSNDDKNQILESFRNADYYWVILGMAIGLGSHWVRALRWNLLINTFTEAPRTKTTFLAVMSGYLANLAVPRLGELTRCSILYRTDKVPVQKSLGTVITERSIDLFTFILLFVVTLMIQYKALKGYVDERIFPGFQDKIMSATHSRNLFFILFALALMLIAFVLLRRKLAGVPLFAKVINIIKGFWHGILSVFKMQKPWLFLVYTVAIWTMYFFMIYLCFFSLSATNHLGIGAGLAVLTLGTIGIIVTPGGIGLYPIIVAETLLLYGSEYRDGFALGWITWTSQTVMIILFGTLSLVISMTRTKKDAHT